MVRSFVGLVFVVWLTGSAAAQDDAGTKVYKQVLPSVVWVHSPRPNGKATGTGTLIDKDKRIILTNYHVVEDNPKAKVYFPHERNGEIKAEKRYYEDRAGELAIAGRVIGIDKQADLALIQVESVPKGVSAVPLAKKGAEPGASVHSIGNTGKSDALWGYVQGKVRSVYEKKWRARLDKDRILNFRAKVVETDSATNPGDSGGPLVNNLGELVGVTQGGAIDAQLVSTFVDVSEVKRFLQAEAVGGKKAESTTKPKVGPARDKPAVVLDGAKMLKPETVTSLQKGVDELFSTQKIDVLMETYASVPADDLAKVKAMKASDRRAYMREWADKRSKAENINGFTILVSNDPKSMFVEMSESAKKRFPEEFEKKVIARLIEGLKAGQPDDGLSAVITLIRDNLKPTP